MQIAVWATETSTLGDRLGLFTTPAQSCVVTSSTLITAPTRHGKTPALSAWAATVEQPVAWVSLDSDDNEPAQLWAYVLAALNSMQPDVMRARNGVAGLTGVFLM